MKQRCTVIESDKGQSYWLAGDKLRFLVSGEQTGGAYAVAELEVVPGAGPPPHVHTREHELFYVLEGELQFIKDQTTFRAGKGFAALLPKNITHTFRNVGSKPAKALVLAFPGGFDRFALDAGEPWTGPKAPSNADIEKLLSFCPKYGIEMRPQWQATQNIPAPASDQELWVMGQHVTLKLCNRDTDGNACVCEGSVTPGTGIPKHAHAREDELFYVLEGTCQFVLDGQSILAGPGTLVHVPKGAMHGFSNPGSNPVRFVNIHTPGGFEDFFLECGVECTDRANPPTEPIDVPRALEVMKRHGMTLG
jgi:quercetin dioxygenase-like cupin family protein